MAKKAKPSASLAAPPIVSLGVLAILAILGILGMILIAIGHPVFTMLVYVSLSAAVVYYLAKVIIIRGKYKPLYLLGSFFALLILCIVAPSFMSLFPPTEFAVTGEAALAQATLGESATASQMVLCVMPIIAAGALTGIAAGRAKTTIQLILLSLTTVLISIFIVFALLLW